MADDDFALMVDFSSLDEAFGGSGTTAATIAGPTIVPPPAATAPTEGDAPNQNGAAGMVNGHDPTAAEQSELDEALAEWEDGEDDGGNSKWKVELTEIRVEMLNSDGPRACAISLSRWSPPVKRSALADAFFMGLQVSLSDHKRRSTSRLFRPRHSISGSSPPPLSKRPIRS